MINNLPIRRALELSYFSITYKHSYRSCHSFTFSQIRTFIFDHSNNLSIYIDSIKVCLTKNYIKNMVLENDNKNSNKTKDKIILPVKLIDDEKENVSSKPAKERKKITIEVYEDDPCLQGKIYEDPKVEDTKFLSSPGLDPRFQQQNQTLRCYVMYTDFYRCEHILGEGHEACAWFKRVFTSICPNDWINNWDELRTSGRLPWHKYKTQGNFPGDKYGV